MDRILSGNYGCEECIVRCGREIRLNDSGYGTIEGVGPEHDTLPS